MIGMIARNLEDFLENPAIYSVLNLKNKNIQDKDCPSIAEAILDATNLRTINLNCNFITIKGALEIACAVAITKNINLLHLDFNEIDPVRIPQIKTLLGDRCSLYMEVEQAQHAQEEASAEFQQNDSDIEDSPDWLKDVEEKIEATEQILDPQHYLGLTINTNVARDITGDDSAQY